MARTPDWPERFEGLVVGVRERKQVAPSGLDLRSSTTSSPGPLENRRRRVAYAELLDQLASSPARQLARSRAGASESLGPNRHTEGRRHERGAVRVELSALNFQEQPYLNAVTAGVTPAWRRRWSLSVCR